MRVVATAGHVDHGKSTLVRALTGRDPDRLAEERARGLTIDLGYAWTTLPGGEALAFVDVPGHQRFIGTMLAGLGPAPAVALCVAADAGWCRQSQEHLDAARALGVAHGVLVITRCDLADPGRALAESREALAGTPLAGVEAVAVSAATGAGLDALRAALGRLAEALPEPVTGGRVRLWIDRVFTVKGAGTVVTGTLESGTVAVGDTLDAAGRPVTVRGVQALEQPCDKVEAVARVALNLRGVAPEALGRGDVLLTPEAWHHTTTADVRLDAPAGDLPEHLTAHAGTLAFPVRVRPLDGDLARLTWQRPLPLATGDRLVLRDPGRAVLGGVLILDADPPPLTRRGAARARAESLRDNAGRLEEAVEIGRRGVMTGAHLRRLGGDPAALDGSVRRVGDWLIAPAQWDAWLATLGRIVDEHARADPLRPSLPSAAASAAVGLPDARLVAPLAEAAGLVAADGHLRRPGVRADLGAAERALAEVERRLAERPFAAPDRVDLDALGLGPRQLAAAVTLGRLIDLGDGIVLAPSAPAVAMRTLAAMPQPFTAAQAKQALDTTRRVAIPLLEHLDRRGWTRRLDATHREVVR